MGVTIRNGNNISQLKSVVEPDEDLKYIKYQDDIAQIENGIIPPSDEEYDSIIQEGYSILDYVFRGIRQ